MIGFWNTFFFGAKIFAYLKIFNPHNNLGGGERLQYYLHCMSQQTEDCGLWGERGPSGTQENLLELWSRGVTSTSR